MGTNYYVRRGIRPSKIEELKKLVNQKDIYDGTLQEALDEFQEIHIGKSSMGWQFLFDHNNYKYYTTSKDDINRFIQECLDDGGTFEDEYGNSITLEDFWKMVEEKKDGFTQKTYYDYALQEYEDYLLNPDKYKDRYIKPYHPTDYSSSYPEIYGEGGLRFSYSTDFC